MSERPDDVDLTRPNAARMYDWYLGGGHNFEVDREFGAKVDAIWPNSKSVARHNRAFLQRVVRDGAAAGIHQFLDIGSGIPTVGNVHEVALGTRPDARIVYVDHDPVAFSSAQLLLAEQDVTDRATIVQADLRGPATILDHPETRRLLNFAEPVCLLMVAVLHFIGDQDLPTELIARYRERLALGSRLAVSHLACDQAPTEEAEQVLRFCDAYRDTNDPLYCRNRDEVTGFFAGMRIMDPGVVFLPDWRPDRSPDPTDTSHTLAWCGVAEQT